MKITTALLMMMVSFAAKAQNTDEADVIIPIDELFTAMNRGDSVMLRGAFAKNVTMATIYKDDKGNPAIRNESSLEGFMKAVGTPHAEAWTEPIWDLKIQVSGNFAQAWASYAFYRGKTFSHCGIDAFQLFKGPDGKWRIFHLADTRQKEGCHIPADISKRFE